MLFFLAENALLCVSVRQQRAVLFSRKVQPYHAISPWHHSRVCFSMQQATNQHFILLLLLLLAQPTRS